MSCLVLNYFFNYHILRVITKNFTLQSNKCSQRNLNDNACILSSSNVLYFPQALAMTAVEASSIVLFHSHASRGGTMTQAYTSRLTVLGVVSLFR